MYKAIGTYSWPNDPEGFEEHYWNVHMPIARTVPGLEALSSFKADESGRESGIYRYADLAWADKDACEQAQRSPEWAAMTEDAMGMMERFGVTMTAAMGWDDEPR
jgi:uncharacterized protein (TIGR02118 family)